MWNVINVVKDIQQALYQQKKVDMVMLDFRKAFDTVDSYANWTNMVLVARFLIGYCFG